MDSLDLLMRTLTPRNLLLAAALCASALAAARYWRYPLGVYDRWRYPAQGSASAAGRDILEGVEKAQARKVEERYRRVLASIERSRADGFDVSGLKEKAGVALRLNNSSYRRQALRMLVEVEMAVPRKRARYVPDDGTYRPEDETPEVKPVKAKKRRAR